MNCSPANTASHTWCRKKFEWIVLVVPLIQSCLRPWTLRYLAHSLALCLSATFGLAQPNKESAGLEWRDAGALTVEGKGWSDTKEYYDRLPARAEKIVRPPVWNLSRDSAGMCVRFVTDSTTLAARWTLREESLAMPHMPATGVSGLDLYVKEKGRWHWVANGRPVKQDEEKILVKGLKPGQREYLLYLPLYNGVEGVSVGVTPGAAIETAPARHGDARPVVFYGTSITQGGCASRPGMAYPAILGRRLDCATINLGFSGNAHSESEMAQLLAELDPVVFVLDPLPNMTADMVGERLENFVRILRNARPLTPIVLVENLEYRGGDFVPARREKVAAANAKLKEVYARLVNSGQKKIFRVPMAKLLGDDTEGTVDGSHPTDLGFMRMADAIEPTLRKAIKAAK